ncbi:MAG TPA: HEAT repeat domain-containing protein [Anaerolineae bacterium]|nr:HEAT repeat domain-containing protein [Anaerolineae bacterium]
MDILKNLQSWLQHLTPDAGVGPKLNADQRKELLAALVSDRAADRWLAAEALAEGDPGNEGVTALAALLGDADPLLRSEAGRALGQIGSKAARQALLNAAATGNRLAQAAAADGLGVSTGTVETVTALAALLASDDGIVRQSAAEALARLDPPPPARDGASAAPAIQAALLSLLASDDAPMVRRAAALALARWGDTDADTALVAHHDDEREDSRVRAAAALALRQARRTAPAPESPGTARSVEEPQA